jgi:hypothetical protein
VAASAAPTRVSRTIVSGGSNARVVTLDRNSSIAYDAREHRFVNGAAAPQGAEAKGADRTDVTAGALAGERAARGRAQAGAAANARTPASNVRVPEANVRTVAPPSRTMGPPPSRAMAPPPPRPSTGGSAGGSWNQGASGGSPRGSAAPSAPRSGPSAAAPSAPHSAPSASASRPSSGGRPH